jgi:hypothetical protein
MAFRGQSAFPLGGYGKPGPALYVFWALQRHQDLPDTAYNMPLSTILPGPFRALSRALPAHFSGAFSDALSAPQRASASLIRISESAAHFRGLRNFYGECKRVMWTYIRS